MRPLLCFCFTLLFFVGCAHASACAQAPGDKAAHSRWAVDHYVYDASLKRDWAVLVDCEHPGAPARMEQVPKGRRRPIRNPARAGLFPEPAIRAAANPQPRQVAVKAGAAVEVSSAPDAPAHILLAGTAVETALAGQPVRVRLSASGRFILGIALGPHSVELADSVQPSWGKP